MFALREQVCGQDEEDEGACGADQRGPGGQRWQDAAGVAHGKERQHGHHRNRQRFRAETERLRERDRRHVEQDRGGRVHLLDVAIQPGAIEQSLGDGDEPGDVAVQRGK